MHKITIGTAELVDRLTINQLIIAALQQTDVQVPSRFFFNGMNSTLYFHP